MAISGESSQLRSTRRAYALGSRRFADRPDDRRWVQPLITTFTSYLSDGMLVADLGCASGRETVELRDAGLRVVGVDIVPEFVRLAASRYPCSGYLLATLTSLPLRDEVLDGAWASASFLHLSPDEAVTALRDVWRCLRPGGVLYTSMQRGNSQQWHPCEDPEPGAVRYYRYYEPDEWSDKVMRAGFDILRLDTRGPVASNNAGATGWIELYARRVAG